MAEHPSYPFKKKLALLFFRFGEKGTPSVEMPFVVLSSFVCHLVLIVLYHVGVCN
jgi:hypothetical protein